METRVVGLTGGIASGKSTVARLLVEKGFAVVDADLLARAVVEPGEPAFAEILEAFGRDLVGSDGKLDRKRLGERVFSDPGARHRLEEITHPRIADAAQAEVERHAAAGVPVVIYEAALLVENGLHELLDGLIVVAAPAEQQIQRVMERDQLDEAAAKARLAAQLPLIDKVRAATWVIDNGGPLDTTRQQVDRLVKDLQAMGRGA